jgi:MtN3 and saliva related transmembrane protein
LIITKPRIKYLDNIIGFLAAFCTTVAFVPQAIKVYKTKKTDDISFGMFLLICVGVSLWDIYGFMIGSIPVIIANSITLLLAIYIFVMKIRMEKKKLIFD